MFLTLVRKLLKKLDGIPLEWIFITLPHLVILLGLFFYWRFVDNSSGLAENTSLISNLLRSAVIGGSTYSTIITASYIAIMVVAFIVVIRAAFSLQVNELVFFTKKLFIYLGKVFLWLLSISISGAALSIMLGILSTYLSIEKITWATYKVSNFSYFLFGTNVSFAMQSIPYPNVLGWLLVNSYMVLGNLFMITPLIMIFFGAKAFRKLTFALIIAITISIPIWFLLPAVSPFSSGVRNVLQLDISPEDMALKNQSIISPVQDKLPLFDHMWIDPTHQRYDISSLPSMHVAWGTIIVLAFMSVSRWFGVILIPWWIMNAIGAVITFQHYVLDVIAGGLVGLLSWFIVNKLQTLTKQRGDIYGLQTVVDDPAIFACKWFGKIKQFIKTRFKRRFE